MTVDPKFIREVSDIRYRLKTYIITRSKNKDEAQAKSQVKILLDCKAQ